MNVTTDFMVKRTLFMLWMTNLMVLRVHAVISVPGLQSGCEYVYYEEGDVKLGFFTYMHRSQNQEEWCGKGVAYPSSLKYVEAFRYIIDQINKNTTLLPNITLGWVILDTCGTPDAYCARALQLFPDKTNHSEEASYGEICTDNDTPTNYDVAAVIGPSNSEYAIFTAYALGLAHIYDISHGHDR